MDGVCGAHRMDDRVDALTRLAPHLFPERQVPGLAVAVVALTAPPVAGSAAELARGGDQTLDELLRDPLSVTGNRRDFRAVGTHRRALCLAERGRGDEVRFVSKRRADERERNSRRP